MSKISDCSPPAHERPGDCLAAPVEAGQEVGTLSVWIQRVCDGLLVGLVVTFVLSPLLLVAMLVYVCARY